MIIVTGGAGFIGSNVVRALNAQGRTDIIVVDDLSDGTKFINIVDCDIADYYDKDHFLMQLKQGSLNDVEYVFHQGACSTTTEWDGKKMLDLNFEYSKCLLHFCLERTTPFIYASSASVYGLSNIFRESREYEKPLNVYGYSKLLFDRYVSARLANAQSQIVGLRYFNVYGPHEQHKGKMASVAFHFNQQLLNNGCMRLFAGAEGYADGEQKRDFIYVDDVVAVNLWFMNNPQVSGIYNLGTGKSQTFNDVASAVKAFHGTGKIEYIPFPEELLGRYQSFTEADMALLKQAGYDKPFKTVEEGVALYLSYLQS